MIPPTELREIIREGLLSFPITPFDEEDIFAKSPFQSHLDWLSQYKVAGLIVAGGTGEMFSWRCCMDTPWLICEAFDNQLGSL